MISVLQLGTVDYATGLRLQQKLVELRKEGSIGDVLLLLEHTPVITLGRNAEQKNILASPEMLTQRGVEVFECDRGGDVTFHGPGQLVGYPIFDLRGIPTPEGKHKTLGAVDYVRRLEEVLIRTCVDFGIPARRIPGLTGVWTVPDHVGAGFRPGQGRSETCLHTNSEAGNPHVGTGTLASLPREESSGSTERSSATKHSQQNQEAKIAAIGVHISRAVTSHGFALNVNTDLSYFDLIVPCGIDAKPVTSIAKELGKKIQMPDVVRSITHNFGAVFQSEILWRKNLEALLGQTTGVPMKIPADLRKLHEEDDTYSA